MALNTALVAPVGKSMDGDVAGNWRKFRQRFNNYLVASGYSEKADKVKLSLFLHLVGDETVEVFNTFEFANAGDNEKLDKIMDKFEAYCALKKNTTFERYVFFSRKQKDNEPFDQWLTDLKRLASTCEFEVFRDSLIKDGIVLGVRDVHVKDRLLRENALTLERAIEICKAFEISRQQLKELDTKPNITVNAVKTQSKQKDSGKQVTNCRFCGSNHAYGKCPAYGKNCNKCNGKNHFGKVCRKSEKPKAVKAAATTSSAIPESSDDIFYVSAAGSKHGSKWTQTVRINGYEAMVKLDTATDISIMPSSKYRNIASDIALVQFNARVAGVGNQNVPVNGSCVLSVEYGGNKCDETFAVVDDSVHGDILLSGHACEKLGLIARTGSVNVQNYQPLMDKYHDVFEGSGKAKTVYSAKLNKDIHPVIKPCRRVPHALMQPLKKELESMVGLGVIKPITKPTQWVSPLCVAFEKNKKLRVCLDPADLNKALLREHYPLPVFEDLSQEMAGATVFSKLDLKAAFWQIPVDDETSELLCFATPFGRYCFTRLPFGITPASEVCHRWISHVTEGLPFIKVNVDDILVCSKSKAEHYDHIDQLLSRIHEHNLTLNRDKCVFGVSEITFLGYKLSYNKIQPEDAKIDAINKLPYPTNSTTLKSFIGMANFLKDFVPNITGELAPLYILLRSDVPFIFDENCCQAVDRIKAYLTTKPVLRHYDPQLPIKIITDASRIGIGAVPMQKHGDIWHSVKYVTRKLTSAETRWAIIELELLAVTFALYRLRVYLWGVHLSVETDHKPLLGIQRKDIHELSPRFQRLRLKLLKFDFELSHISGQSNVIADVLSRSGIGDDVSRTVTLNGLERQVLSVVVSKPFSSAKLNEVIQMSREDEQIETVKNYVQNGWPEASKCDPITKPFWNLRNDLSISGELLLYREALVIPKSMRKLVLDKIHDGHLGQTKCLERARGQVYWPGINSQIRQLVEACPACQAYQRKANREPLLPHERPEEPWMKVGIDLFYWNGHDYLLAADYASGFPEVVRLQGKDSKAIIVALKALFARYGIPLVIVSDNEPTLVSFEMKNFYKEWGVTLMTSSPRYPQSNGMAERSIQTVKNILKKCSAANEDPYLGLLSFRSAPLSSGESPAQIFLRRNIRNRLPKFSEELYLDRLVSNSADNFVKSKFQPGDKVNIYNESTKCYDKQGVVKNVVAPRSVQTDSAGDLYRRNQKSLRKSSGKLPIQPDVRHLEEDKNAIGDNIPGGRRDSVIVNSECQQSTDTHDSQIVSPPSNIPPVSQNNTDSEIIQSPQVTTLIPGGTRTRRGRIVRKPLRYR